MNPRTSARRSLDCSFPHHLLWASQPFFLPVKAGETQLEGGASRVRPEFWGWLWIALCFESGQKSLSCCQTSHKHFSLFCWWRSTFFFSFETRCRRTFFRSNPSYLVPWHRLLLIFDRQFWHPVLKTDSWSFQTPIPGTSTNLGWYFRFFYCYSFFLLSLTPLHKGCIGHSALGRHSQKAQICDNPTTD